MLDYILKLCYSNNAKGEEHQAERLLEYAKLLRLRNENQR